MNKKIALFILVIIIIVGVYVATEKEPLTTTIEKSASTSFDGKNATFSIDGKVVTLVDGVSAIPAAPGSTSKITTRYLGNEITGDLTGDGVPDTAFWVSQSTGGSGLFYYAVVAMKTENGHTNTNAFFIGDRITPEAMYIPGGTTELHVNFLERKKGEPMTTQPSVGAVTLLKVTKEGVLEGLMK